MSDNDLDLLVGDLTWAHDVIGDRCADRVRDAELNFSVNIRRIGEILVKIIDIQQDIWKVRPDLRTRVATKEWTQRKTQLKCEVRTATIEDEGAILALLEQLFVPPGSRPDNYTRELGAVRFRTTVEADDSAVLVAVNDDAILGMASIYAEFDSIRFGKKCWLEDFVVDAEVRSRQVGLTLLLAARDWAKAHDCTHLQLSSGAGRVDAHRFYTRNGMSQSYCFNLPVT